MIYFLIILQQDIFTKTRNKFLVFGFNDFNSIQFQFQFNVTRLVCNFTAKNFCLYFSL